MHMATRRRFSDKFKATVALAALRGDKTVQEIAAKIRIHPTQVTTWKRQAIDGLTGVFSDKVKRAEDNEAEVKELHAKNRKIGGRERFFVTRAEAMSPSERKAMINRDRTDLSLTRQCKLLRISRLSLYYTPVGMDAHTLKLMSEIDRVFTKYPFFHCPADRRVSATEWVPCGSPSATSPYAGHGAASHLQRPQHQQKTPTAPDLPVSASRPADHAPEPGLVQRYYLYSCTARLALSGRDYGLGDAENAGVAVVQHTGCQLLCRGAEAGGHLSV